MIDVVLFLLVLTCVLAWYLGRVRAPRSIWAIAAVAFAVRVGFVLVDDVVRMFAGSGDAPSYERTLWFVAEQWRAGALDAPLQATTGPGNAGYYEVLYSAVFSPVYFFFGRSPMLVRLAMALLGAFVVVNAYMIGRELLDERAGLWAGGITAVFPYWIYLSGVLYRDTLVVLLFTWMVYYLLRWQVDSDRRALALCLVATGLGLSLRLANIPAVAALFAVAVYTKFEPSVRQKVATIVVLLGAAAVFVYRFGDEVTVHGLAGRRRHLARERPASYLTDFTYESAGELVAFAPVGMLYFALVPFPWQAVNGLAIVSIVQNLFVWYPIVLLAVFGTRDSLTVGSGNLTTLPLVAFALAGLFTYGLVEGNMGPAMRHRSQFQFVFFAFAGVALARRLEFIMTEKPSNTEGQRRQNVAASRSQTEPTS